MSFGKHSLRLGAEVMRIQHNYVPHYYDKGLLYFLSFPDFLLGLNGSQTETGVSNVYESLAIDGGPRQGRALYRHQRVCSGRHQGYTSVHAEPWRALGIRRSAQ